VLVNGADTLHQSSAVLLSSFVLDGGAFDTIAAAELAHTVVCGGGEREEAVNFVNHTFASCRGLTVEDGRVGGDVERALAGAEFPHKMIAGLNYRFRLTNVL
jgi:hypothetical protein